MALACVESPSKPQAADARQVVPMSPIHRCCLKDRQAFANRASSLRKTLMSTSSIARLGLELLSSAMVLGLHKKLALPPR